MNSFVLRAVGVILLLLIIFFVSRGVHSVSKNPGEEISQLVYYPEAMIAKELNTSFEDIAVEAAQIPGITGGHVKVRTNGDLKLIELDKHRVGVNTDCPDYL